MEDIALSKSLRRQSWPVCLGQKLQTSARRWREKGVIRTIVLMWALRLGFFLGVKPEKLATLYYPAVPLHESEK